MVTLLCFYCNRQSWNAKYYKASTATQDREAKIEEVAEMIEQVGWVCQLMRRHYNNRLPQNLTLLGATAIEDKLQEASSQIWYTNCHHVYNVCYFRKFRRQLRSSVRLAWRYGCSRETNWRPQLISVSISYRMHYIIFLFNKNSNIKKNCQIIISTIGNNFFYK